MPIAKTLIVAGILLIIAGGLIYFFGRIPGIGRLPGDIFIKKENFAFYFPFTTSILVSLFLSFIFLLWHSK